MGVPYAQRRACPYCGTHVKLADCPIVATNFDGVEGLGSYAREAEIETIKLPSGATPTRVLPKTGAPVIGAPPSESRALVEAATKQSRWGATLSTLTAGNRTDELPPLLGPGVQSEDLPARACTECQFPLPQDIDQREAVVIAVVGVNRVGKTHLLAAMANEAYKNRALSPIGCTEFAPEEVTSARFRMEYDRPLFRHGQVLDATQALAEQRFRPLVFNTTLAGAEPFNLVLHDIAGESLADPRQRAQAATFLRAARGIVFVIDPRDIEAIEDRLPSWIVDEDTTGYDQAALLSRCLAPDGFAEKGGWLPVAVTVGKSDLLREALDESLPFLDAANPAAEDGATFLERVQRTSDQVEALLERLGAHNLLAPARSYRERAANARRAGARHSVGTVTFHAVSPLGSTPTPDGTMVERVKPINCIDPLAAVLSQADLKL